MRRMYDAAYPPANPPAWEVVAGYIGGDTPHVWTAAEWAEQRARYRLPIWTRSNPAGHDGAAEGAQAAAKAASLGCPAGSAIGLDLETAVDAAFVSAFDAAVVAAGFKVIAYGSSAYIFKNPRPSAGYWDANWNHPTVPFLTSGSSATQYAGDSQLKQPWDASLVADSLVLWDTVPTPAPAPPPPVPVPPVPAPPAPAPQPQPIPVSTQPQGGAMHIDLQPNVAVAFANPAAVHGGSAALLLSADFGNANVRVALYSISAKGWSVHSYPVTAAVAFVGIPLTSDVSKASLRVDGADAGMAISADVV